MNRHDNSWWPVDLRPCIDGTPVEPTVGAITHTGQRCLYPGREHVVVSTAPERFVLASVAAELRSGSRVVCVSFTDTDPGRTVGTLRDEFQVPAETLRRELVYCAPEDPTTDAVVDWLCADREPTLVVLDGRADAFHLHRLDPGNPIDVSRFRRVAIAPWAHRGAAVVVVDYRTADSAAPIRGVNGAVYAVTGLEAHAIHDRPGRMKTGVTKKAPPRTSSDQHPGELSSSFVLREPPKRHHA